MALPGLEALHKNCVLLFLQHLKAGHLTSQVAVHV